MLHLGEALGKLPADEGIWVPVRVNLRVGRACNGVSGAADEGDTREVN